MSGLTASQVRRRFLVLRATRWFPTGLLIPVLVLYLLDRGLDLTTIGFVTAAQGVAVMLLELPTGGLADAIGRRRVLLLANLFELVGLGLLLAGKATPWFLAAFAVIGVYRALESGPLDAWFVDSTHAAGVDGVDAGLQRAGVVLGLAIAAGSGVSGLVVASAERFGLDPLGAPILLALLLRVVDTSLVWRLMSEIRPPAGVAGLSGSVRSVPRLVGDAVRLLRRSRVLAAIVAVELFWGFGMVAFETLFPPRLSDLVGGPEAGAALMGPVAAGAWLASSVGAAGIGWFSQRFGRHVAAAGMRILQGATVVAMALAAGAVGAVTAYLACFVLHGAANPVHLSILHDQAATANRATILSMNSLMASMAAGVGGIALGAVADGAGLTPAMLLGGLILASAAPLYLFARRWDRSPAYSVA